MNFWRSSKSGFRVAKTPKSLPSASGGGAIEVRSFSDSPLQRGSGVSPLVKNGIFRFPTSAEDGASPFQPQPRNTSHEDKVEGKGEVEEGRDGHRGPVARHGAVRRQRTEEHRPAAVRPQPGRSGNRGPAAGEEDRRPAARRVRGEALRRIRPALPLCRQGVPHDVRRGGHPRRQPGAKLRPRHRVRLRPP